MYLLCGIMSGKGRKGWLVFALVLYSLGSGVSAANKLAKLPAEEEPTENFMDAFVQPAEEAAATTTTEE